MGRGARARRRALPWALRVRERTRTQSPGLRWGFLVAAGYVRLSYFLLLMSDLTLGHLADRIGILHERTSIIREEQQRLEEPRVTYETVR